MEDLIEKTKSQSFQEAQKISDQIHYDFRNYPEPYFLDKIGEQISSKIKSHDLRIYSYDYKLLYHKDTSTINSQEEVHELSTQHHRGKIFNLRGNRLGLLLRNGKYFVTFDSEGITKTIPSFDTIETKSIFWIINHDDGSLVYSNDSFSRSRYSNDPNGLKLYIKNILSTPDYWKGNRGKFYKDRQANFEFIIFESNQYEKFLLIIPFAVLGFFIGWYTKRSILINFELFFLGLFLSVLTIIEVYPSIRFFNENRFNMVSLQHEAQIKSLEKNLLNIFRYYEKDKSYLPAHIPHLWHLETLDLENQRTESLARFGHNGILELDRIYKSGAPKAINLKGQKVFCLPLVGDKKWIGIAYLHPDFPFQTPKINFFDRTPFDLVYYSIFLLVFVFSYFSKTKTNELEKQKPIVSESKPSETPLLEPLPVSKILPVIEEVKEEKTESLPMEIQKKREAIFNPELQNLVTSVSKKSISLNEVWESLYFTKSYLDSQLISATHKVLELPNSIPFVYLIDFPIYGLYRGVAQHQLKPEYKENFVFLKKELLDLNLSDSEPTILPLDKNLQKNKFFMKKFSQNNYESLIFYPLSQFDLDGYFVLFLDKSTKWSFPEPISKEFFGGVVPFIQQLKKLKQPIISGSNDMLSLIRSAFLEYTHAGLTSCIIYKIHLTETDPKLINFNMKDIIASIIHTHRTKSKIFQIGSKDLLVFLMEEDLNSIQSAIKQTTSSLIEKIHRFPEEGDNYYLFFN
jgi:hypothetical protein